MLAECNVSFHNADSPSTGQMVISRRRRRTMMTTMEEGNMESTQKKESNNVVMEMGGQLQKTQAERTKRERQLSTGMKGGRRGERQSESRVTFCIVFAKSFATIT